MRAAVRLEHARFSIWTDRARVLGVLARDFVMPALYRANDETHVVLREGAIVRRLAQKDKRTQVRYVGAIEVEGWVPDELSSKPGVAEHRSVPQLRSADARVSRRGDTSDPDGRRIDRARPNIVFDEDHPRDIRRGRCDADADVTCRSCRRDPTGASPEQIPTQRREIARTQGADGTCRYTHIKESRRLRSRHRT